MGTEMGADGGNEGKGWMMAMGEAVTGEGEVTQDRQDMAYRRMLAGWVRTVALHLTSDPDRWPPETWLQRATRQRLADETRLPLAAIQQITAWAVEYPDQLAQVVATARAKAASVASASAETERTERTDGTDGGEGTERANAKMNANASMRTNTATSTVAAVGVRPTKAGKPDRRCGPQFQRPPRPRKTYQPRGAWQQPRLCAYPGCGRTFIPLNYAKKNQRCCCQSCARLLPAHPAPPYPVPNYPAESQTICVVAETSTPPALPVAHNKPRAEPTPETVETQEMVAEDAPLSPVGTNGETIQTPNRATDTALSGVVAADVDTDTRLRELRYLIACEIERVFDARLSPAVRRELHTLLATALTTPPAVTL